MDRKERTQFKEEEILKVKSLQNLYDMQIQERIGINLRRIRNESGMTMQELHYMTRIPYAILSKMENLHTDKNPKKTSIDMCSKLAMAFQMSLEELTNELLRPTVTENRNVNDHALEVIPEYPANLVSAVLGESVDIHKINYSAVYRSLKNLPEREHDFIEKKFCDGMTYDEIGKMNGITRERSRQIVDKGIKKLQKSDDAKNYMLIEPAEYNALAEENRKLKKENKFLKSSVISEMADMFDAGAEDVVDCMYGMNIKRHDCENISIEELDLSVRAYNCLKSAGINMISDIEKLTISELNRIRNLGEKSSREIQQKLYEKYGISLHC